MQVKNWEAWVIDINEADDTRRGRGPFRVAEKFASLFERWMVSGGTREEVIPGWVSRKLVPCPMTVSEALSRLTRRPVRDLTPEVVGLMRKHWIFGDRIPMDWAPPQPKPEPKPEIAIVDGGSAIEQRSEMASDARDLVDSFRLGHDRISKKKSGDLLLWRRATFAAKWGPETVYVPCHRGKGNSVMGRKVDGTLRVPIIFGRGTIIYQTFPKRLTIDGDPIPYADVPLPTPKKAGSKKKKRLRRQAKSMNFGAQRGL